MSVYIYGSVVFNDFKMGWSDIDILVLTKNKLCPNEKALKFVLKVRKNPLKYLKQDKVMDFALTLSSSIKEYADVLEKELNKIKKEPNC